MADSDFLIERRRHPRLPLVLSVVLSCEYAGNIHCKTVDVSDDGLGLSGLLDECLHSGSTVRVAIDGIWDVHNKAMQVVRVDTDRVGLQYLQS